jgi:hypothetical protein
MRGINPQHLLRLFYRLDVQVHRDRLAIAAAQHALQHLGRAGVDFLVRNVGGHVDEVARPGLRRELQMSAPAHACTALDDVDHALQMAVMVRPGFGVGVDGHGAGPQLLSVHASKVDRGLAIHARCLGRVGVEPVARNHPHAIVLPGWWRRAGAVLVRPSIGMFVPVAGMLLCAHGYSLAPASPPVIASIQRRVNQVAKQVAKEDSLVRRLHQQHGKQVFGRIDEERRAADAAPEVLPHRTRLHSGLVPDSCRSPDYSEESDYVLLLMTFEYSALFDRAFSEYSLVYVRFVVVAAAAADFVAIILIFFFNPILSFIL